MTVDGSQGNEFDVVAVSMVLRGPNKRAFINLYNRFNVLVSRVKSGMIILADVEFINSSVQLKGLMKYLHKGNAIADKREASDPTRKKRPGNGTWNFPKISAPWSFHARYQNWNV